MKSILKLALLIFTATILINCSDSDDYGDSVICEDVGLTCDKSPFSYKACADSSANAWWELNGTKYYDVIKATEAYENYCD